uniref:Uncharacterized protein n=1 Tax=Anopheles minimus TaxID=112268 RepID=A0A182WAX1_9DIPT
MLKRQKQLSTVVKFQGETLDEKETVAKEDTVDTGSATAEVVCDGSSGQIPCSKTDSLSVAETLTESTAEKTEQERNNVAEEIEHTVDSVEAQAGSRKTPSEIMLENTMNRLVQVAVNRPEDANGERKS